MIDAAVVAAVFLLYVSTYASIPAGDGYWALNNIDRANLELLFNPPSLLTQLFFFGLRRVADAVGLRVETLTIMQAVNALAAGVGAAVLGAIVRSLGGSTRLAVLTAAFLVVSYGYWQFADGELQLLSLVVLLLITWLIVRARGGEWTWRFTAGVALLNALAALLRQENVLFGLAAVTLLAVGRPWRAALRDALVYAVVGAAGTWIGAVAIGLLGAPGVTTLPGAVEWYLWIFTKHVGATQDFQGFEYATRFDVPRVIKGQLTAVIVGTQAVFDALRDPSLLARPYVVGLGVVTLAVWAIMATLAGALARLRRAGDVRLAATAAGCAVWILAYKLMLHGWLWPTVTKYQVVTVPPLLLLCVLGVVAAERAGDRAGVRRLTAMVAALVAIVFVVDLHAGILPWRHYGQMKAALEVRRAAEFRADDFFVSAESGLDPVFARLYRGGGVDHLAVKDLFLQTPAPEAFAAIRAAIDDRLRRGHRVFVYNLVPGPYTLVGINQARVRGGVPLQAADFQRFLDTLRATYTVSPVFTYWEESKVPLYRFGERLEPFLEVRARS